MSVHILVYSCSDPVELSKGGRGKRREGGGRGGREGAAWREGRGGYPCKGQHSTDSLLDGTAGNS